MTQEERDTLLLSMNEQFKEFKMTQEERDNLLLSMNEKLSEHDVMFKKITDELIRLRQNVARLENDVLDKIGALFDAHEVNSDKIKEHNRKFNSIERTLDKHNSRLLKLECK